MTQALEPTDKLDATAGVDGEVVLTPEAKARLADRIQHLAEPFAAMPVRRVYIPKQGSSTKRRPLGIPVVVDRVHQARVLNALEPEWEARFEPRSYGFRLFPVDDQPQTPRECEHWLLTARATITQIAAPADGTSDETQTRLIHARCHGRRNANRGKPPALLPAREPSGLA